MCSRPPATRIMSLPLFSFVKSLDSESNIHRRTNATILYKETHGHVKESVGQLVRKRIQQLRPPLQSLQLDHPPVHANSSERRSMIATCDVRSCFLGIFLSRFSARGTTSVGQSLSTLAIQVYRDEGSSVEFPSLDPVGKWTLAQLQQEAKVTYAKVTPHLERRWFKSKVLDCIALCSSLTRVPFGSCGDYFTNCFCMPLLSVDITNLTRIWEIPPTPTFQHQGFHDVNAFLVNLKQIMLYTYIWHITYIYVHISTYISVQRM